MKLTKVKFNKLDLEKIPESERTLLIFLAHAANELNVLSKLFKISIKTRPTNEIERQAMNVQGLLCGRLLAGKLYEIWQLFTPAFFASKISIIYEPLLNVDSKDAFAAIKQYFGKVNLISTIRNKHAFHYSIEQMPPGFAALDDAIPLEIYIDESNTNTMYAFADHIANLAVMASIDPKDHHKAMHRFMTETSDVIGWFNLVLGNCMTIAMKKYLSDELIASSLESIQVENAPEWESVTIPFFIESPAHFSFPIAHGGELTWGENSMSAPDFLEEIPNPTS